MSRLYKKAPSPGVLGCFETRALLPNSITFTHMGRREYMYSYIYRERDHIYAYELSKFYKHLLVIENPR